MTDEQSALVEPASARTCPSTPRVYNALEVNNLEPAHFVRGVNGKAVRLVHLPTTYLAIESQQVDELAILSWRWDVDQESNSSRNVYVACQEARRQGVRYLLLDKVTVDQTLCDKDMLDERLAFSRLYQHLPVIAAYDHTTPGYATPTADVHGTRVALGSHLSRIMRRPWICYEVKLYASNPTRVTYVGHVPDLGCSRDGGFIGMAKRLWEDSFCQTILYTLAGTVGMHRADDFRFILPRYFDVLTAASGVMSLNDYLLTTALLTGRDTDRVNESDGVNNDQSILGISFDRFRIGEGYPPTDRPRTQDYYTRYDIYFRDRVVGRWQTRHKLYPFEDLRVWFTVESSAEQTIYDFLGVARAVGDEDLRPDATGRDERGKPALALVFHEKDAL